MNHTCAVTEKVYVRRQRIIYIVVVIIFDKFVDPKTVYTPKDIANDMFKSHGALLT